MDDARHEILEIAQRMLRGQLHLIEGCRAIVRRHGQLRSPEANDPAFKVLVAIESETDDVPVGEGRALWDPGALKRKDEEAQRYIRQVEPTVREACEAIIARLTTT